PACTSSRCTHPSPRALSELSDACADSPTEYEPVVLKVDGPDVNEHRVGGPTGGQAMLSKGPQMAKSISLLAEGSRVKPAKPSVAIWNWVQMPSCSPARRQP